MFLRVRFFIARLADMGREQQFEGVESRPLDPIGDDWRLGVMSLKTSRKVVWSHSVS